MIGSGDYSAFLFRKYSLVITFAGEKYRGKGGAPERNGLKGQARLGDIPLRRYIEGGNWSKLRIG